jgi:hypothetical protein
MSQASSGRLCTACGAVMDESQRCTVCAAKPATGAAGQWVLIEAQLVCRVCGLPSPLAPLHDGSEVTCSLCGKRQAFDPRVWKLALDRVRAEEPASAERRTVEAATEDVLPRRDGTSIRVEHVRRSPPEPEQASRPPATLAKLIPELRAVKVENVDPFRGSRASAWVLLGDPEAAEPAALGALSEEEAKDEPKRDRFGLILNSCLVVGEIILLIAAGALTGRLRTVGWEFWALIGAGGVVNWAWGWAGLSLAQRPSESDVWAYYLIVLAPQAIMVVIASLLLSGAW